MAVGHGIPGRYSRQFRKTAAARNDNPPHPIHAANSIGLSGAAETMPDADLTQFGRDYTDVHRTHTPAEDELASVIQLQEIDVNTKGPWGHPMC